MNFAKLIVPILLSSAACSSDNDGGTIDETKSSQVSATRSSISPAEDTCDRLAAHPYDPQKPSDISGVQDDNDINVAIALPACSEALWSKPMSGRLRFQYARVMLAKGDRQFARQQFINASRNGSEIARAYAATIAAPPRRVQTAYTSNTSRPPANEGWSTGDIVGGLIVAGIGLYAISELFSGDDPQQATSSSGTTTTETPRQTKPVEFCGPRYDALLEYVVDDCTGLPAPNQSP